jgi:hypothetical protein
MQWHCNSNEKILNAMPPKLIVKTPDSPPESAQKNQFNRFQPEMPRIPGVSDGSRRADPDLNNTGNNRMPQIVAIAAAVLLISAGIFWWSRSKSRDATSASTDPEIPEETSHPPAANFSSPIQPVHDGPTVAGTVEELSNPWAAKQFTFVKPITHENIDAMVIRLPGGDLWAFSLQAPYGTCKLEFVTDLAALASAYRFRAVHPMVVNPCDSTVFDPLKVGTLDGNTWARGQIVQGGSLRPPIAIDVKVSGRSIVAQGIE